MKRLIHKLLRRFGYDVVRYSHKKDPLARLAHMLEYHGIDVVFDIGANIGQYGSKLREIGYKKNIVSFEPIPEAYDKLEAMVAHDRNWQAVNLAVGNQNGEQEFHVAQNSQSSSLLSILSQHIRSAPRSQTEYEIRVKVGKIDTILNEYIQKDQNLFVKMDTQGAERMIMDGAQESLRYIKGFQIESSLVPLYSGEMLFFEMVQLMETLGYTLAYIDPGFIESKTGQLLQADGLYSKLD